MIPGLNDILVAAEDHLQLVVGLDVDVVLVGVVRLGLLQHLELAGREAPAIGLAFAEAQVFDRHRLDRLIAHAIHALDGAPGIHALAADTDGIDGSEDNAGALGLEPRSVQEKSEKSGEQVDEEKSLTKMLFNTQVFNFLLRDLEGLGAKLLANRTLRGEVGQAEVEIGDLAFWLFFSPVGGAMIAAVVLAEAEIPKAMAEAFRSGRLGVMDYYKMENIQSDTAMRGSIANPEGKK